MVLSGHCVAITLGVGLAHSSAEGIGELLAYGFWDCRLFAKCFLLTTVSLKPWQL